MFYHCEHTFTAKGVFGPRKVSNGVLNVMLVTRRLPRAEAKYKENSKTSDSEELNLSI